MPGRARKDVDGPQFSRLSRRLRLSMKAASMPAPLETWENYIQQVYCTARVKALDGEPSAISGILEKADLGSIRLSQHQATPLRVLRSNSLIANDRDENYFFIFVRSGRFDCRQRERSMSAGAGELCIVNSSEKLEVDSYDFASSLAIALPAEDCRLAIPGIDDKCCGESLGDPIFRNIVRSSITTFMHSENNIDSDWLKGVFLELLDATLNTRYTHLSNQRWSASRHTKKMLLATLVRVIEENLHYNHFSVADAALACHVSERYLQLTLKEAGTNFGHELLQARLNRASTMLRSPIRSKQIQQIAFDCGFTSNAHFSTRYKSHFGVSPRDEAPEKE